MIHHHKPKNSKNFCVCEGCLKSMPARNIIWFCGHWLCGKCKRRQNMPLIGYKNNIVWKAEQRILRKKRFYPFITWNEKQLIWREGVKLGLTPREIKGKIRSIIHIVRHNHWAYLKKQGEVLHA